MISFHHIGFLLVLTVTWYTSHAQWAQSLGWGGAGTGKRVASPLPLNFLSLLRRHATTRDPIRGASSLTTSLNSAPDVTDCQVNPGALKMFIRLVEEEEARVHQCLTRKYAK
ncbi:uncharacterized protein LOC143279522 [Babylonia areolata]|uniref:uncharacterized protein LOC143279522 n=1 Tax=Babylonia areolata TaxID=304850 RepID=UPI003FD5AD2E